MAYQILNHLGEELIASITDEALAELKDSGEFNCFQWDENPDSHIVEGLKKQKEENPELDLDSIRLYKIIEE